MPYLMIRNHGPNAPSATYSTPRRGQKLRQKLGPQVRRPQGGRFKVYWKGCNTDSLFICLERFDAIPNSCGGLYQYSLGRYKAHLVWKYFRSIDKLIDLALAPRNRRLLHRRGSRASEIRRRMKRKILACKHRQLSSQHSRR